MKTGPFVWLAVLGFLGLPFVSFAQRGASPTLRSIVAAVEGGVTIVTITADGPLPAPSAGTVDTPPIRVFFDFTGVNPFPRNVGRIIHLPGAGAVSGIRAALYTAEPNVTRVVLDLQKHESFTVNTDDQISGRIRILVGSPSRTTTATPSTRTARTTDVKSKPAPAAIAPPVRTPVTEPPAPDPPPTITPPTRMPAPPDQVDTPARILAPPDQPAPPNAVLAPPDQVAPAAGIPAPPDQAALRTGIPAPPDQVLPPATPPTQPAAADRVPMPPSPPTRGAPYPEAAESLPKGAMEIYRRQLSGSVERLELHRSLIAAIDLQRPVSIRTLELARTALQNLHGSLTALRPAPELGPTHDLLLSSCSLSLNAVTLRIDAEQRDDAEGRRNAASAAAGGLMLLQRACAMIGCALK